MAEQNVPTPPDADEYTTFEAVDRDGTVATFPTYQAARARAEQLDRGTVWGTNHRHGGPPERLWAAGRWEVHNAVHGTGPDGHPLAAHETLLGSYGREDEAQEAADELRHRYGFVTVFPARPAGDGDGPAGRVWLDEQLDQ